MEIKPETKFIGKNIIYFKETDSTNTQAKITNCENGTVFIADSQTNGRGRMGRSWLSEKNSGIYMSISLVPNMEIERIMQISLVAGLAVCEVLNEMYEINTGVKWPNDVVIEGKKICGILTEAVTENQKIAKIICGIGINTENNSFPQELSHIAASLTQITEKKICKNEIISKVLEKFEMYYNMLSDCDITEKYKEKCVTIGKEVAFEKNGVQITGIATDISPHGELIVEQADGNVITVNSGEVSVRGIYGEYC